MTKRFTSEFKINNFINGEFIEPNSGEYLANENPATGEQYSLVASSQASDVEHAINSAHKAFPEWSGLTAIERSNYMMRMAQKIQERHAELSLAESIDSGKPLALAQTIDIPRSQKNLEFFAQEILTWPGPESYVNSAESENEILYSPLGVVACISPWNLPLYLFTWKVAPALAAGNTVVAKPSEMTPMTAQMLCEIARDVGLPPGVFNVVHGLGPNIGSALVRHPAVKAVTFTGSTATGKLISQMTAGLFKKLSLEMGGKNANIIFADCDFEKALQTTLRSSFSNQGQICLCGSRILIERSIYNKFKSALVEKTNQLSQGDPLDLKTDQGALVSREHQIKVLSFIEFAKNNSGKILCGGQKLNRPGYFVQPTLIEGMDWDSKLNQEEIFGPVATLTPFDTVDEAIQIANSTEYGLSASVWSLDINKARTVATKLETGIVWINTWMTRDLRTPFGGVKNSGMGREGGRYALEFMSEAKTICKLTD
jgi:aminomuconate-semialdehyde/2-hydroxymuconate-6-semialdehyde dehydrogenase